MTERERETDTHAQREREREKDRGRETEEERQREREEERETEEERERVLRCNFFPVICLWPLIPESRCYIIAWFQDVEAMGGGQVASQSLGSLAWDLSCFWESLLQSEFLRINTCLCLLPNCAGEIKEGSQTQISLLRGP